jgi:hypothetical protein
MLAISMKTVRLILPMFTGCHFYSPLPYVAIAGLSQKDFMGCMKGVLAVACRYQKG